LLPNWAVLLISAVFSSTAMEKNLKIWKLAPSNGLRSCCMKHMYNDKLLDTIIDNIRICKSQFPLTIFAFHYIVIDYYIVYLDSTLLLYRYTILVILVYSRIIVFFHQNNTDCWVVDCFILFFLCCFSELL